jgi:hypothetical protein
LQSFLDRPRWKYGWMRLLSFYRTRSFIPASLRDLPEDRFDMSPVQSLQLHFPATRIKWKMIPLVHPDSSGCRSLITQPLRTKIPAAGFPWDQRRVRLWKALFIASGWIPLRWRHAGHRSGVCAVSGRYRGRAAPKLGRSQLFSSSATCGGGFVV